MQLARLVLIGATLGPEAGFGGQAFIFSLSSIWECSLRRIVEEISDVTGWIPVLKSARTRQWNDSARRNDPARWLTADVMVRQDEHCWVLDAKHKRSFGDESRTDRFQMCAYALGFDADRVSLVYPTAGGKSFDNRVLLDTSVGGKRIVIDSIDLPMAAGPAECEKIIRRVCCTWSGYESKQMSLT